VEASVVTSIGENLKQSSKLARMGVTNDAGVVRLTQRERDAAADADVVNIDETSTSASTSTSSAPAVNPYLQAPPSPRPRSLLQSIGRHFYPLFGRASPSLSSFSKVDTATAVATQGNNGGGSGGKSASPATALLLSSASASASLVSLTLGGRFRRAPFASQSMSSSKSSSSSSSTSAASLAASSALLPLSVGAVLGAAALFLVWRRRCDVNDDDVDDFEDSDDK
jgi:hypothetical protein